MKQLFLLIALLSSISFSKTITITHSSGYFPFSYLDTAGNSAGMLIDWWNLWGEKSDDTIKFIPFDNFDDAINRVEIGDADIIAGLFYSDERAKKLNFGDIIIRLSTNLFLSTKCVGQSLDSISCPVGVVKGDYAVGFLKEKYPKIELTIFEKYQDLLLNARNKTVDAFIYDIPKKINTKPKWAIPKGYTIADTLFTNQLRAAVKLGNREMRDEIMSGSDKISQTEILKLAEQWSIFSFSKKSFPVLLSFLALLFISILITTLLILRKRALIGSIKDRDWLEIISRGETNSVEFKSSLRYDYRQKAANKVLEKVIVKTISAFLNSDGGTLFIGVDDEGEILGLENDYGSLGKKNSDGFVLTLTNLINVNVGKKYHNFLEIDIIRMDGKEFCAIAIQPSDSPVFLGKEDKEEFFIRASASSQPLGLRETHEYISSHWG
jgi:hypothetical protein